MAQPRIDTDRLWSTVERLGEIGELDDGAMMRVTGSDADRRARDQVVAWFEDAGLDVRVDPVGNIVGRRNGNGTSRDPVMSGSHVDTVPRGGKFDGTAGVLTALEAVRAWNDAGIETARPVEIVVFTEEEGTRFGTGLLGSFVASGQLPLEDALSLTDDDGNAVGDVLSDIGYTGEGACDLSEAAAFVELHVEQGPSLERAGDRIGVVDRIVGISHNRVTFEGEANHAGTTPMTDRRDAFAGAAAFTLWLERAARNQAAETSAVGTGGKVIVSPNGTNVVPGHVELGVDIRDADPDALESLVADARREANETAGERGLEASWEVLLDVPPTPMEGGVVDQLEAACRAVDVPYRVMPSGAGHDAMNAATVTPTGMLFVPSRGGVSHSPAEYTSPEQLADGTRVLSRSLRELAG